MISETARVVAIGGGHGLAATLEALAGWCDDVTAVVSVADDGGSSGRLRRDIGIPAPGDMRRCLAALTPQGVARDALEHRFTAGDLSGHAAGNLWLAALLETTSSPVEALDVLAKMVGARGRVLPATRGSVDLVAHTPEGRVLGQVAISAASQIKRITTVPPNPLIPAEVEAAIAAADAIVVGPGSLFTSVLAPLVPAVMQAIEASSATVVYVANLAPDDEETRGFTLRDHVEAVLNHGLVPNVILADLAVGPDSPGGAGDLSGFNTMEFAFRCIARPNSFLHDPDALGIALSELVRPVRA